MNIFANPPVRLNQSINLNFLLVPYDGKSTTQSVKIQDNLNQIWNSPSFAYIRWQFSLYSGRRGWYFSLFHVNSKVNFDDETSNQFESAWGWMENNEFFFFSFIFNSSCSNWSEWRMKFRGFLRIFNIDSCWAWILHWNFYSLYDDKLNLN